MPNELRVMEPSGDPPRTAAGHTVKSGYSSIVEPKNGMKIEKLRTARISHMSFSAAVPPRMEQNL